MRKKPRLPEHGTAPVDQSLYTQLYPYYAEICALTEIRKKPGFGVPLNSGIGGHLILYLNGVRRDRSAGYPTLVLCGPDEDPAEHAVCISVNAHYKNANWVAAEGRDFIWNGALGPNERLTEAGYTRTQAQAQALGLLEGVEFQDHLFREQPAHMTAQEYMYELSAATDYALRFGREIYSARVPLDATRMAAIVDYLNTLNAPYRDGTRIFKWHVMQNNCVHVIHNALAAAGIWHEHPTFRPLVIAAFTFPVPKNEFVDFALRTNDLPIENADAIYRDKAARRALMETGTLPTAQGALTSLIPPFRDNDVYDVEKLRLIFFDHPFFGAYPGLFNRALTEARFVDLEANLRHFAGLYRRAHNNNRAPHAAFSIARAEFQRVYTAYIAEQAERVNRNLAILQPARLMETVS